MALLTSNYKNLIRFVDDNFEKNLLPDKSMISFKEIYCKYQIFNKGRRKKTLSRQTVATLIPMIMLFQGNVEVEKYRKTDGIYFKGFKLKNSNKDDK